MTWLVAGLFGGPDAAALRLGFIPARLSGGELPVAAVPALLTPLSSTLVHGNFAHLAFNLLIFSWCGTAVERVLGRWALVGVYVAGAYGAALAMWLSDPLGITPTIGASGAVSAVIGAFALSFGRPRQIVRSASANRWINAAWLLAAWVVLQIAIGWLGRSEGYLLATPAPRQASSASA